MKTIKWIIFILIGIVVFLLIIAAFQPSHKEYSSSVSVKSSPRIPYTLVNNMKNWEKWSPFQEGDTAMIVEYTGPEAGVGAAMSWISKKQGNGSMTIFGSIYDKKVSYLLDFGMGHKDTSWFMLDRTPDGTNVTWASKFINIKYPVGRIMWLFAGGMMDKAYQKGLDNLKQAVESKPADCKTSEIKEIIVPAQVFIAVTDTITTQQIGEFLGHAYGKISQFIATKGLKMTGMPVAFYNGDPTQPTWIVTAAMPVLKAPGKIGDGLTVMTTTEQKVVSASHFGDYSTSPDSYYKLEDYMKEKGLMVAGSPWEEYVNDPTTLADPMQIETRIYFPVK